MKKKNFVENSKIVILGLLLGLGIGMLQAASWEAPSAPVDYSSNAPAPLNVGLDAQVKPFDSSWLNATNHGQLKIWGAFSVSAGAQFAKSAVVNYVNTVTVNGNKKIANNLNVTSLINSTGSAKVCIDDNGKLVLCAAAVNGACGSSNGAILSSAPTANLCNGGTPSDISGTGPWTWTCAGINGGTTASCSAQKGKCTGTYTQTVAGYCSGTVNGSKCADGSRPLEGESCENLGQSSCPGTVDPWCFHGCHWNAASTTTYQCSTFSTQSQCEARSSCSWGI